MITYFLITKSRSVLLIKLNSIKIFKIIEEYHNREKYTSHMYIRWMNFRKLTVLVTSTKIKTHYSTGTQRCLLNPTPITIPLQEEITFLTSCNVDWFGLVLNFIQMESPGMHSFVNSLFHSVLCF